MSSHASEAGDAPATGAAAPSGTPGPRRRRGRLLLFLIVVGLLVVVLAFWPKSVNVDISVKASRVSFKVDDQRFNRLFNSIGTKSLTVSTFEKITLTPGKLEATSDLDGRGLPVNWQPVSRPAGAENVIVPEGDTAYVTFNGVTLNSLVVPEGADADIIWSPSEPDSVKLSFDKAATGAAAMLGELIFSCNQCRLSGPYEEQKAPPAYFRLAAGHEGANTISFTGRGDSTVVVLDLPGEAKFKEQSIALPGGVRYTDGDEGSAVSTIIEGKINFEDKVKDEIVLPEGAMLVPNLKDATIRTLTVSRGITVDLHGRAEKLMLGSSERDLKEQLPSVLEWLYVHRWWAALYSFLVGVIGMILIFKDWWSGADKR
jgi:hypothetical protein